MVPHLVANLCPHQVYVEPTDVSRERQWITSVGVDGSFGTVRLGRFVLLPTVVAATTRTQGRSLPRFVTTLVSFLRDAEREFVADKQR